MTCIKIDRISSLKEANELQEIGCNLIGISLFKNKIFNDERYVSIETAKEIRNILSQSELVVEIGNVSD